MMLKQVLAVCLPLLLISVGISQALNPATEAEHAMVEVQSGKGTHRIPMSLEAATIIDVLLQNLTDAIHTGDRNMMQQVLQQLSCYGIDVDLPSGLLDTDATPISNRLCIMYGYFSKALFSYPLDLAVAGILSLFNGFGTIGLFLLWSVLTHALHPVHIVAPLIFMTVIDGSIGQLVTRGLDGRQIISADELSTHVILGFVGTIINIIVPVNGAPDPAFCVGAALRVTPAP